ncbi:MAG: STAS domain-containing protein [Acidimicrobiales bacterium]
MDSALEIQVQDDDTSRRVHLRGEIDLATAHQLRDALVQHAKSSLALDLSDVSFLDSSGIGVILSARERVVAEGRAFTIDDASESVRQVLAYSGLSWLLIEPADSSPPA